jgi:hypothetical protein
MKRMIFLMLTLSIWNAVNLNAQVLIGGNEGDEPHPGAILDLSPLEDKKLGLLLPNVSLSNDASAFQLGGENEDGAEATGMIVYNTSPSLDGPGLYVWDGSEWIFYAGPKRYAGELVTGESGEEYRTYCYPNGVGCWMIDNSKEGTPSTRTYPNKPEGERGYYYRRDYAQSACPNSNYQLPSAEQAEALATYINSSAATLTEKEHWLGESALAGYVYVYKSQYGYDWDNTGIWLLTSDEDVVLSATASGLMGTDYSYDMSYSMTVRCIKK